MATAPPDSHPLATLHPACVALVMVAWSLAALGRMLSAARAHAQWQCGVAAFAD
jgi:hypothetical protein